MANRCRSWFFAILGCGLLAFPALVTAGEVDEFIAIQERIRKFEEAGQHASAIPLAEELARRGEKLFANQPQNLATALDDLAGLYQSQGRYAEAEPLFQRSLKLREKALGPDHPTVANSLNNLAILYRDQARYAEAEPLYQRSLKLREKALGPDHPQVAASLNGLAVLYFSQGRYAEVEPLFLRSLNLRTKALGPNHPRVADSLSSLANLYTAQARYAEAEPLYQQSLKLREKALGPDHPQVADSLYNLAILYRDQGRYAEAEPLILRSLKLREKTLGPNHPDVAYSLNNLANLYESQGRYAEAEPLYQRSLKLQEKTLGPDHPAVATSLNNLAILYHHQDRYAEAEPLILRSLKLREKALGPDHADVAASLNNLAHLYYSQGRYREVEPLLLRSLNLREKALGSDHPDVAANLNNLASLYHHQDRYAEAEPLYQRSLKLQEKTLGPDHPDVAISLYNLANLYGTQGRYAEAEPLIDRAIAIRDRAGVSHKDRYKSYLLRSRIAWNLRRRSAALADLRKAMDFAESQRTQAAGAERERAEFFSSLQAAFEQMVTWQYQMGDAADLNEVMAAIERTRARSLLDDMTVTGIDLDAGRPIAERDQLRRQGIELKSRAAQLEKQWERAKTAAERTQLLPELAKAREAVYQQYRDQRASSPIYRKLLSASGAPITLKQLQQTLTPDKSLLLVYFLGEQAGFVVAIQSDQVRLTALAVSDEAAKILGCDAGPLTAKRMQAILMNEAKSGVMQKLAHPDTSKQAVPQLATLWPLLVPEAQRVRIQGGDLTKLMIVPDGPLSALPFEALIVNEGDSPTYLLDVAPPIQYAPSATVLFNLQQRATSQRDPMTKPVLAVGNAQYGRPQTASGDSLAMLTPRSRYVQRGGHLQPLPFSGTEVAWVADVFSKSGIGVGRLLQAEATEANIRFNVPGRRIVHFACHGLVDQEYGNFFGSLAVTPGPNAATNPADDGFLTLAEIYQLDFKNCELAILSACDTNFGPHQRGEGTWALSRGFLVAGARRVVASNWLVDDEAAASLVSYFCGGLAGDEQKGKTSDYSSRLQSAKRWVRQQDKWSSPYYWAPFVLVGPN